MGYLAFDSFTSNWQDELFTRYRVTSLQMMAGVNFFSVLLTFVSLLEQGCFDDDGGGDDSNNAVMVVVMIIMASMMMMMMKKMVGIETLSVCSLCWIQERFLSW